MRELAPGMGRAVAERTVLRKVEGEWEDWGDVADRVAWGNVSLAPGGVTENLQEYAELRDHIANGRLLMSGRHLQHGDMNQKHRNMEVFTNCATAATSALSFHLLLNGSGVGRCYDDDMMVVDWDQAPNLVLCLDSEHEDASSWADEGFDHFDPNKEEVVCIVHDSREGWAKALEVYETMTYLGQSDKVLVLDFSNVRPSGAAIKGMQDRPSSGPIPTMQAFKNIRDNVVGKGMPKWKQAMYVDHYMAESVLVGGARRAARIAVKYWKDEDILDYIKIKEGGVLWSANNSVGVDQAFWDEVGLTRGLTGAATHGNTVFEAITEAAYHDGTGEPGFLNLHKLNTNEEGWDWEELKKGEYVGSNKYQVEPEYKNLLGELAGRVEQKRHKFIVNPCFAGDTLIPVKGRGLVRIEDLRGQDVEVRDGNGEWQEVRFRKTGEDQPLLSVELSDGSIYRVTPEHSFMQNGERVKAKDLVEGSLIDSHELLEEHGTYHDPDRAWLQAWYMCDGTEATKTIRLYEDKQEHYPEFEKLGCTVRHGFQSERQRWCCVSGLQDQVEPSKDRIPDFVLQGTLETKLSFIRGVLESDGHVGKTSKGFIMQVSSIRRSFLEDLQQLLYSIGAYSKVNLMHPARMQSFPDNKEYWCQDCWRITVTNPAKVIQYLWPERLKRGPYNLKKEIHVVSVEDLGESADVYCCTVQTTGSFQLGRITTGNCGEIVLSVLGGFCVIADVVPYHCEDQEEFEDVVRHATRSLIRVNTMDSIYRGEVGRTNRIGVGCTGLHEYAWDQYRVSFLDAVDPVRDSEFSLHFWLSLDLARSACERESTEYSRTLGVSAPHTCTTIKPAGTTSKLFGLTEGCHLPAMTYYLRWVQFRSDDPLVDEYIQHGYPHKELQTYSGMTAVGFPTKPKICDVIPEDQIVTAGEANMDQQFTWLSMLEKDWLGLDKGNQLSYTLKYRPDETSFEEFQSKMLEWMPKVRCVSVMPQVDMTAYEYQPEEPITREQYDQYMSHIEMMKEDISREHMECEGGACPIDFKEGAMNA